MFLSKRVTLIAGCVLVMAIALSVAILPTAESFDPPNQTGTGTLIESNQTSTVAQQGEWRLVEAGEASSGSYLVSADGTENVLSLIFEGTTVEIQYVQGPDLGTLAIEIDGTVVRTIDTTSDTAVFGDRATIDYLDDDVHILRVYPAEGKVAVDAFWATPSQFSTPTPTGTPEVPDYFYYYQDQKIPLVLSTEWIAVRFGTNDPAARQQAVAQTSALMGNVTDGPEYASFEITLVPLAEGIDQRSVEALLAAGPAEDVTAIEAIFPVFAAPDYDGGLLILTDEFIARFAEDRDEDQIAAFNTANGVEAIAALEGLDNTYVLRVTDDSALNALDMANFYHDSNMTVYAEPNFVMQVQPTAEPTDINYGDQWYLNNTGGSGEGGGAQEADADIDWQEAWDARVPADESEVVVAILDDNFDVYHPDLVNKYVTSSLWRNYPDGTSGASAFDVPAVDGFDNHGTTLAGIVAAETDNNEGIAGVCWNCKVLPIRVLDWSSTNTVLDNPATNPTYIVSGINHAQGAGGADVILIGWTMASSTTVDNIIETAVALGREQKGTVIVAAAGHKVGGANAVAYPANRSDVVSVGATNWCDYFHVNVARYNQNNNSADCNNDGLDWGTNYGNKLLISAPGMNLYTTDRSGTDGYGTGNYTNISGTSGSAAIVAGVVGLVLSYNPDLNYQQTADFLYNSADDVKPTYHGIGWDQYTGYGRVNAYNALEFAKGTTPATLDRPWQGYPTYGGDLTYEISDIPSEGEWVYIEVKTDADVVQIGQWYELSSTCSTPGGACYCDTQAATCEITPGVMLDGGTYRWRVKFWESGVGDLPWSNLVTFLINAPEGYTDPDGPLIFYPDGESDNLIASHHEGDPYYIWDHVNAPYYELYIADINGKAVWDEWYEVQAFCPENNDEICVQCSDDPDGDGPLRGQCQVYPTAKSANDDFLLPGTGWYRWWVRAWGESEGYGPWSVAEWFELDPGSIPNQPTIPGTSGSEEEGNPTSFENPYEVIFWDHEDGNSWYEVYLKNTTTGKLVFRKWYKAGPIGC
ncbi:MAG: S8 family serine peptidase, partial [Chloroflexi bacterium]|nr:S8 family serine peptidase [Chloroflexota bacterium]